jgi:hypothetical protein
MSDFFKGYDQWKTTDPRDHEPEEESALDQACREYEACARELRLVRERLSKTQVALRKAVEALTEIRDYKPRSDEGQRMQHAEIVGHALGKSSGALIIIGFNKVAEVSDETSF